MTSFRLFIVFMALVLGLLLSSSTTFAQHNDIESRIESQDLAPDSRVSVMIKGLLQALKDFAGEGQLTELVNQDGELMVLVREADGTLVSAYNVGLAGHLVNMTILAVDGNGEVISANPYISSDTEK